MENPADIYTTGIPMSEKGNFGHNKYGCEDGSTVDNVSVLKLDDHGYPNNSLVDLRDSTCDNDAYISNSIQDGFQSEILCSFVCGAGLQPDLPMSENPSMEIESVSQSDTHIDFSDSPGTSFPGKIEPFSPMEGLVSSLDEQLDSYLLSGFKEENRPSSEDGNQSVEEEQRNVTEAICDIAKSFGLEDLLPETFQVEGNKDNLYVTVSTDDLCDDNENIGELSLGDFDRCPELNSPVSSLSLDEQLAESYVLNGLEMISENKSFDSCINSKVLQLSKEDQSNFFLNSKGELFSSKVIGIHLEAEDIQVEVKDAESVENVHSTEQIDMEPNLINQESVCDITDDLVRDIPTVSISDAQIENSPEMDQKCPTGTVLITTDKASKKMQIVLTLEQGQQIYDIDTESIETSQQPLNLDFPTSFSDEKLQEQNSLSTDSAETDEVQVTSLIEDKAGELFDIQNVPPEKLTEFICNVPAVKVKKSKTWLCPVEDCGQILDKECKLRVHMISHKGARPFKCTFDGCDWAFTTPYRLRRHEETHLGSKDYLCDFEGCNRKFTTVYNLKTHKTRHKWPNSLTCPSKDCKMIFANRRKMELHLKVHKDVEAPYKCSLCGKQYYSANCIASHYRTHQYNEDDFKCPFQGCGKVYDKICRLRQHIRHHTGDRPYTCPAEGCKWNFTSASKLTRHMRKHTGERKFVCTEPGCGKSFMRPEHLKGHIVIHSGDKPFHCPHENCNARFTAKSSLYVHVKKHCPSVLKVVYPCPVESCVKKYNSKATLKQHVQKLHPEMLQDGKQFNIAEKLELIMPVSVVNPTSENSLEFLDFDEIVADDPAFMRFQLLSNDPQPSVSPSTALNSAPITVTSADVSCKTVPKARTASRNQNTNVKETAKNSRTKETLKPSKLSHTNKSGCARTDYCCKLTPKPAETPSYIYLNQNSNEAKNYLLNNQLPTDIKSPDIMLTSSSIYHENPSDQLIKSHFSSDNSSTSHSLYADDSLLVGSGAFGSELIPVSLLSDGVDSDESVLNTDSSGIVFSEQNGVDAFSEHLHGLD